VAPDQLTHRTPCHDFDVRALLNHLMWVVALAEPAARKLPLPEDGSVSPERDYVQGDWRASFAERMDAVTAAWAEPDAWTGTTTFAGGELPARLAGELVLVDLVVHGWDLARATAQDYGCDGDVADAVYRVVSDMAEMGRSMGLFADPVEVPDNAGALARALGLAGRAPRWAPPTAPPTAPGAAPRGVTARGAPARTEDVTTAEATSPR
jgi:uncharacterized protein (TIGR03086 family)